MRERTRPLVAALSFLTVVPVGRGGAIGGRSLSRGAALFPAVGAAVGALTAVVAWGASFLVPAFPAAVLGIASGVVATAALHLDGLGDVADGIGASLGGREPTDAMRDPRLGTFGVAAVALDLLLKTSLLATLLAGGFPWPAVAAGALSRASAIAIGWRLPYAGGGTGAWTEGVGVRATIAACGLALAIAAPSAGLVAVPMVPAIALGAITIARWSRRRLGGITGDGLGAAIELGETLALAAAVAMR